MKNLLGFIALSLIVMLFACNQSPEPKGGTSRNAAAEPKNRVDSIFEEVMAFHDEAMPKMGKLKSYEDLARLRIDSLSKLGDAGSKALKAQYEQLVSDLQQAQKGMNDWMDGFTPDKYADKDSMFQYYLGEKVKAEAMRNKIFAALDSAKGKFGK